MAEPAWSHEMDGEEEAVWHHDLTGDEVDGDEPPSTIWKSRPLAVEEPVRWRVAQCIGHLHRAEVAITKARGALFSITGEQADEEAEAEPPSKPPPSMKPKVSIEEAPMEPKKSFMDNTSSMINTGSIDVVAEAAQRKLKYLLRTRKTSNLLDIWHLSQELELMQGLPCVVDQIVVSSIESSLKAREDRLLYPAEVSSWTRKGSMKLSDKDSKASGQEVVWRRAPYLSMRLPMLHPEARVRLYWMIAGFAFILWEMMAVPVYLAFNMEPQGVLFWISSVITAYFLLDIILNFFCGYMDASGIVVRDPRKVAITYIKGWLIFDMLASIPWDWISLGEDVNRSTTVIRGVRIIRTFRMLRLLRLVKVAKLGPVWDKIEAMLETNHEHLFLMGIFQTAGVICVACHWCACVWYAIGKMHMGDERPDGTSLSWIQVYQTTAPFMSGQDLFEQYIVALYFCVTTMMTVGYGDISPKNIDEVRWAIVMVILSSILYSHLMGTLVELVSTLNKHRRVLIEKKVALSRYLRFRVVPWNLMMSIRTHLLFLWAASQDHDAYEEHLKVQLSPLLRMELCHHIFGEVLSSAPFLAWMKDYPNCTKFLAQRVESIFLTPGDFVFRMGEANKHIFLLLSGRVIVSRIEHLLEQDADRLRAVAGIEEDVRSSRGSRHSRHSRHGHTKITGWRTTSGDEEVFATAAVELHLCDLRRADAARTVQRCWRERMATRRAQGEDPAVVAAKAVSRWLKMDRMNRTQVVAPAYFGESCLWQPLEDWDREPPPEYLYHVVCDSSGELVQIRRDAIKDMLGRFSPWLPERLELFRNLVQKQLQLMSKNDDLFKQLVADWATLG